MKYLYVSQKLREVCKFLSSYTAVFFSFSFHIQRVCVCVCVCVCAREELLRAFSFLFSMGMCVFRVPPKINQSIN